MIDLQLALQPTYLFDTQKSQAKHWIIIGAGGNGGYFIPQLARAMSLANRLLEVQKLPIHTMTIIDADKVEDKNLTRQNFLPIDVSNNKAKVMANRYGRAFGLEINYIEDYMESADMLKDIIRSSGNPPIVVGAVDNNATRAIVYEVFKEKKGMYWLDAGNEEFAGQVVLGYNAGKTADGVDSTVPSKFNLPSVADIYPEILEQTDKLPTKMSCAERAVSNPQNIYTNQTAANIMLGFANSILQAESLKYHAVVFNSETNTYKTTLNKKQFLVKEEQKAEVEA